MDASTVMLVGDTSTNINHDSTGDNSSPSNKNSPLREIQNIIPDNSEAVHSGSLSGYKRKSLSADDRSTPKRRSIDCLPSTSKVKRQVVSQCKISWEDIDKFNLETQDQRNIAKIKIDSEKFISYIKSIKGRTKELQLLKLSQEFMSRNANNVLGTNKYLMFKIIEHNGYKNYLDNLLIQEIAHNPNPKISHQLKSKLLKLNTGNNMLLASAAYNIIYACQADNISQCVFGIYGLGYSAVAPQVIQNTLFKNMPKFIDSISIISGKLPSQFFGYNTKLSIQLAGAQYGPKVASGVTGVLSGVLDIFNIAIAVHNLFECGDRKKIDSQCSDKDIRDNVATISISTVSFVSGILITTGATTGPWGIALGCGIIAIAGIYNGVSNVIEYEEKYNTTSSENWSVFWRTALLQQMAQDVQSLSHRTDSINVITNFVTQHLSSLPNNIVAYAMGFGKESVVKEKKLYYRYNYKLHTINT